MSKIGQRIISALDELADSLENNKPVMTTRFYHDEEGNLIRDRSMIPIGDVFDEQDQTHHDADSSMGKG